MHPAIIYEESNMFVKQMGEIQEEADHNDEEMYRMMEDESNQGHPMDDDEHAGKLIFPE